MAKTTFWICDVLINSQLLSIVAEQSGGNCTVHAVYLSRVFKSDQKFSGACVSRTKIILTSLYDQKGSLNIALNLTPVRIYRGMSIMPLPKLARLYYSAAIKIEGKIELDGNAIHIDSFGIILNAATYAKLNNLLLLNIMDPKFILTAATCNNAIFMFEYPSHFIGMSESGRITRFSTGFSKAIFDDSGSEIKLSAQKGLLAVCVRAECQKENNIPLGGQNVRQCNTTIAHVTITRGTKTDIIGSSLKTSYLVCGKVKAKVKEEKGACLDVIGR